MVRSITSVNSGYRIGDIEAMSINIDKGIFHEYDYVIHIHPDVFITDDVYLMQVLEENKNNNTVFFITKSVPNDDTFFSLDFFIFKPKLLTQNIFKKELYTFTCIPEKYFHDMIQTYDIPFKFIRRFDNDNWQPRRIDEHLKLYHEHDLEKAITVYNQLVNQPTSQKPGDIHEVS